MARAHIFIAMLILALKIIEICIEEMSDSHERVRDFSGRRLQEQTKPTQLKRRGRQRYGTPVAFSLEVLLREVARKV